MPPRPLSVKRGPCLICQQFSYYAEGVRFRQAFNRYAVFAFTVRAAHNHAGLYGKNQWRIHSAALSYFALLSSSRISSKIISASCGALSS